jgi:hypothetical protein
VISDRSIWAAALALVRRYDDDALLQAVERGTRLLSDGDFDGAVAWYRIIDAIERLQAPAPGSHERVH